MVQQTSRFRWRDKLGRVWEIYQIDDPGVTVFSARSRSVTGKCIASVLTGNGDLNLSPFAVLADIRVDWRMENRGLGSMLLSRVIAVCRARRHEGIEGKLSRADSDHFDKLKHFYEKFGFTVTFYPPDHPRRDSVWLGEIRLEFQRSVSPVAGS